MRRLKTLFIVIALVLLLACVLVLKMRRDKPQRVTVSETSRAIGGPAFEVNVDQPIFSSRPPWHIPGVLLGTRERGPRLDQSSPGAKIRNVAPDHLEIGADGGWEILIETDSEGRLATETHLAFPIVIGGRPLKFDCRPADRAPGYLQTVSRAGSGQLDGSFILEVTTCKNAVSGKTAAWPSSPLTIRGSFAGVPYAGETKPQLLVQ